MKDPAANSARAKGRQGVATDAAVITQSDFAAAIVDLEGDVESKNIMIYGDSGCGKTVLIGSAPNSLILACEPGYISAARNSLGVEVGRRQVRQISNTATLLAGLDWLESGNYKKFEWVILEGATTLEMKVRLGYAAEAFDNNPASRAHRNLPDKPDYFNTQNFLASAIARFVDLPVNFLITAHAMRMDDDAGDRQVMPAFQKKDGALSNYVSGLMHCVGFMRPRWLDANGRPTNEEGGKAVKQVRRILWQQMSDPTTGTVYFAKDQFTALGTFTDDINMQQVIKCIDGEAIETPQRGRRRN